MPILCCVDQEQPIAEMEFERNQDMQIAPCSFHRKKIQFICDQIECNAINDTLLCKDCLQQHKGHNYTDIDKLFTYSLKSIIADKNYNTILQETIDKVADKVIKYINNDVIKIFNEEIQKINTSFLQSLDSMKQRYKKDELKSQMNIEDQEISSSNIKYARKLHMQYKMKTLEVNKIEKTIIKSLNHFTISIIKMLSIIYDQTKINTWDNNKQIITLEEQLDAYEKHVSININQQNYFYFSNHYKQDNIQLQSSNLDAVYHELQPERPVAMTENYINDHHYKFGFIIKKMDNVAFFFNCTTIYLGVCNFNTVKIAGMKKINEYSKGSYLISSAGLSYHHKKKHNRLENVGWTFGQGDNIIVQIIFDEEGVFRTERIPKSKIKFTKKGRFFDSTFQLPLQLQNEQIYRLKPCVSFDANIGAIVHLYDIQ